MSFTSVLSFAARRSVLPMRSGVSVRCLSSVWSGVPMGPPDPILGLTQAFKADANPKKINLGVGAYRDDDGKPYILPTVREAERRVAEKKCDHEYAGITGVPELCDLAADLVFGADSSVLKANRNITSQAISGTGALTVLANFIKRHHPHAEKGIYMPSPTWPNHIPLAKDAGLEVKTYGYYDKNTCGLDFQAMMGDLSAAPDGSVVLLHACAHNPTGVDPDADQWNEISQLLKSKSMTPFFDCAYQGFASGDCDRDVYAVRKFVNDGHNILLAQSFAKNFGLYGERVGACTIVCQDEEEKKKVESQLKILIRPMYSNPPIHGARLVSEILKDPELTAQWKKEVKGMADRIITMRHKLVDGLKASGSTKDWSHITNQIGMFSFTGLTPEQCDRLINEFSIYLTRTGRISIAGITSHNVGYLAESMHAVSK